MLFFINKPYIPFWFPESTKEYTMKTKSKKQMIMSGVVFLSFALAIRQMSMTIVMPFLSTYCKSLSGYSALLAGLVVGIFGLMQAIFQIPFGILSDHFGNKRLMIIGLSQVVIGLLLAFYAKNIYVLIFARALQGSGAVIGVGYSWAAGMAGEKERTHAMEILSGFISAAAALAFAIGPVLRRIMPVNYMFLSCAILLLVNEFYIIFFMKDQKRPVVHPDQTVSSNQIRTLLHNKIFLTMNLCAFINNYMMVSVFFAVPVYLSNITGETGMWKVFLPAIFISILVMKQAMRLIQRDLKNHVLIIAFLISSLSLLLYFHKTSYLFLLVGTTLFMCGYITIATIAASKVNDTVPDQLRGTANGIFNSFQYIGNFVGALVTGALWGFSETLTWIVTIGIGLAGCLIIVYYNKQIRYFSKGDDIL